MKTLNINVPTSVKDVKTTATDVANKAKPVINKITKKSAKITLNLLANSLVTLDKIVTKLNNKVNS